MLLPEVSCLDSSNLDRITGSKVFGHIGWLAMTLTWLSWPMGDPETLTVWHLKLSRVSCCDPVLLTPSPWPASATGGSRGGRCTTVHNKPIRAAGLTIRASRAMLAETCRETDRGRYATYFPHTNCLLENKHHSLYEGSAVWVKDWLWKYKKTKQRLH